MEDKIVKVKNLTDKPLPQHAPGEVDGCDVNYGCAKCQVPTWNRIEFPFEPGETIVVKENVGRHLEATFRGKLKVVDGPYDTTQLLSSPDGFFEYDKNTGKMKPLNLRTETSLSYEKEGETIEEIKASQRGPGDKGRFLAVGGV